MSQDTTGNLLIVDDERSIRLSLRTILGNFGFEIVEAARGEEALALVRTEPFDAVLLDINMPGMGGIEVCRLMRKAAPRLPILMLTVQGGEERKVEALDAGADDYVTKPFSMNELLARIRAQLRRAPAAEEQSSVIGTGDFSIDLEARSVKVAGAELHLTPKEFELLVYLARRPGKVVTHRTLLGAIWGANSTEQPEYLRVFIGQLRKKIESDPSSPKYLLTEPWVGYRFEPGA